MGEDGRREDEGGREEGIKAKDCRKKIEEEETKKEAEAARKGARRKDTEGAGESRGDEKG